MGDKVYIEWINVNDRMPKESKEYLVVTDIGNVLVLSYSKNYNIFNADDDYKEEFAREIEIKVKYWAELPQIPEDDYFSWIDEEEEIDEDEEEE